MNRRGVALVAAVVGLLVAGLIVAGLVATLVGGFGVYVWSRQPAPATAPVTTTVAEAPAPASETCVVRADLPYADGLAFDLYHPGGRPPVVVYVHGGGWTTGNKAREGDMLARWCAAGFAVVSVQYRLAPANPYPAAVDDVRAAVAAVVARADELGVDASRLGITGTSAGAHLALMASHAAGAPVKAAVSLCGPTDLSDPFYASGHDKLVGFLAGADPREASPISLVDASDPPTRVIVGDRDRLVSADDNTRFVAAMEAAGGTAELVVYPGASHMFVNDPAWRDRADDDTLTWFRQHLR